MRRMYAERAAPRANELRAFYAMGRMSATGEAKDALVSWAKPRRAARVCERRRHPTLVIGVTKIQIEGARRARRRAIRHSPDTRTETSRYKGTGR